MKRRALFALIVFLTAATLVAEDRTVTIESARTSEYIKIDKKTKKAEEPSVSAVKTTEADAASTVAPPDVTAVSPQDTGAATGEPQGAASSSGTAAAGQNAAPPAKDESATDAKPETEKSEIIKFSGNVIISVKEGESVSRICADEIVYDKTRDTLEANGNVSYEHSTGKSGSEKFKGKSLLFNIKKQEGVFLEGTVEQDTGKTTSDPYVIHAEVTGRDSGSTMAFKNAFLTTCDADDPHWYIRAFRVWMLPGNEIAIFGGLFFIGPLPVFPLPFFYYPSDEMIFHPVFGFRNREGYFTQTTTYLWGRKPLATVDSDKKNSFSTFLQGDTLKKQERHGLFLKNLEENDTSTDKNYLKFMADAYSNLGAMVGLDGSFSSDSLLRSFAFSTYLGFSKTLYPITSSVFYTSYDTSGKENWNSSWLFGNKVPFRYRASLSLSLDKDPFQLNVSMPLVSDMLFKKDFLDRSEDLNWFSLLTEQSTLATGSDISSETSYSWNASGSVSPNVTFMNPWITSLSISNLSGSLSFNSKTNSSLTGSDLLYAPDRTFFYPEIIKPEIKLSLAGTIVSIGGTTSTSTAKPAASTANKWDVAQLSNPFAEKDQKDVAASGGDVNTAQPETGEKKDASAESVPGDTTDSQKKDAGEQDLASDAASAEAVAKEKVAKEKAEKDKAEAEKVETIKSFMPPAASGIIPAATPANSVYSLTWSITPAFLEEIRYDTTKWLQPSDINWNTFSSIYYQFKTQAQLLSSYTFDTDLFSEKTSIDLTSVYQLHPLLSDTAYPTEVSRSTVHLSDFEASVYTVSTTNSVKIVPFNRSDYLKPISLAWNFTGDLYRTDFTGTALDPKWENQTFQWDKDYIDAHDTTSVVGVAIGNYEQKLTLKSNLPPLQESYTGSADFAWRFGTLNLNTKLYDNNDDESVTDWLWDPFKATLSWTLPLGITLGQEFTYSIKDDEASRLNLTGSIGPFSAYYTYDNTVPYTLEVGKGWVLKGTETEFIPSATGFTFSNSSTPAKLYIWKNRVYFEGTVTSNLKFNLLKLTNSSFTFAPVITFKILDFLDLSFSSTSSNEVIARYFQGVMNLPETIPGETNLFTDLGKSFNFFSTKDREESGFKLKKLSFKLTHYLHDWTMNFKTTLEPKLKSTAGVYYYEFIPTIAFVVEWKPVSDIKTTVRSEEGVFSLNTTSASDTEDTTN
jgi:lipopolysaccharide assembly outer membrane protein LptD (OstA)